MLKRKKESARGEEMLLRFLSCRTNRGVESVLCEIVAACLEGKEVGYLVPTLLRSFEEGNLGLKLLGTVAVLMSGMCIDEFPGVLVVSRYCLKRRFSLDVLKTVSVMKSNVLIRSCIDDVRLMVMHEDVQVRKMCLHFVFNSARVYPGLVPEFVRCCRQCVNNYDLRPTVISMLLELSIDIGEILESYCYDFLFAKLTYFSKLVLYFAKFSKSASLAIANIANRFSDLRFVVAAVPMALREDCLPLREAVISCLASNFHKVTDPNLQLMMLHAMKEVSSTLSESRKMTPKDGPYEVQVKADLVSGTKKYDCRSIIQIVCKTREYDIVEWFLSTREDVKEYAFSVMTMYHNLPEAIPGIARHMLSQTNCDLKKEILGLFRCSKIRLEDNPFCRALAHFIGDVSDYADDLLYLIPTNVIAFSPAFITFLLTCAQEVILRGTVRPGTVFFNRLLLLQNSPVREVRIIAAEIQALLNQLV